jgi:hypothetical protein
MKSHPRCAWCKAVAPLLGYASGTDAVAVFAKLRIDRPRQHPDCERCKTQRAGIEDLRAKSKLAVKLAELLLVTEPARVVEAQAVVFMDLSVKGLRSTIRRVTAQKNVRARRAEVRKATK